MSPTYFYDLTNRLVRYKEAGTKDHVVEYTYDTLNNLTKLTETIDGVVTVTTYQYDADNRITSETTGNATVVYAYDAFGRLTSKTTKNGAAILLTESYTYTAPTAATTSAQIATYTTVAQNGYSVTYSYTYDDNGNILSISDGSDATSYVYDSANQLIRENNEAGGFTYTWEYDAAGNILNKKEYAYTTGAVGTPGDTVAYSYTDSGWGDLLTSYDGTAITYDGIGNPAKLHGWSFTWEHGRQLASMSKSGATWKFTYNADGLRTKRAKGTSIVYNYVYNGGLLMQMTKGSDTLDFTYDASDMPLTVTHNGTTYYYVTNLQGDIVAITDNTGATVVTYTYDAWGNILTTTDGSTTTLGTLNPLRYRGYVYDEETGLYYLQSRYYDPVMGRFVNADGYVATGQGLIGYNMFAYCLNNPVNFADPTGKIGFFSLLVGVVILAGVVLIPSSAQMEATPEQKQKAIDTAQNAELVVENDTSGNQSTIDIHIDIEDTIGNVDGIAYEYYYEELYNRTVAAANELSIPTGNLMDTWHIQWEFELHIVAYYLGYDNALLTELNVEETPWSMFKRAIGWD